MTMMSKDAEKTVVLLGLSVGATGISFVAGLALVRLMPLLSACIVTVGVSLILFAVCVRLYCKVEQER